MSSQIFIKGKRNECEQIVSQISYGIKEDLPAK